MNLCLISWRDDRSRPASWRSRSGARHDPRRAGGTAGGRGGGVERLKLLLAQARREHDGRSRERGAKIIARLELQLVELEETAAAITAPAPRRMDRAPAARKPARRPLPAHLPRERIVHPAPCTCPNRGGPVRKPGEDVSASLECAPRRWKVIEHMRGKVSCRRCEAISQPPAPSHPIARGRAGPNLLAPVPAKERAKTGRLWAHVRDDRPFAGPDPPAAAFFSSPDRGGEPPAPPLAGFAGIVQADACAGFNRLHEPGRKPGPILAELEPRLRRHDERLSRKSETGKAIAYALDHRAALTRFLTAGRICLSNNAAERAAAIYTLIETAKVNGVDPQARLADVPARLPDRPARRIDQLLPRHWTGPAKTAAAARAGTVKYLSPRYHPDGYVAGDAARRGAPAPARAGRSAGRIRPGARAAARGYARGRHADMKELRFEATGGVRRVAFAFDRERRAVLPAAGDEAGVGERRFYRRLIALADVRLNRHLAALAGDRARRR
jgi:hypothetical protein